MDPGKSPSITRFLNRVIADRLVTLIRQHRAALKLEGAFEAPGVTIR